MSNIKVSWGLVASKSTEGRVRSSPAVVILSQSDWAHRVLQLLLGVCVRVFLER